MVIIRSEYGPKNGLKTVQKWALKGIEMLSKNGPISLQSGPKLVGTPCMSALNSASHAMSRLNTNQEKKPFLSIHARLELSTFVSSMIFDL